MERVISNSGGQMVTENISSMQYHPHEGIHLQRTSTSNRRDSPDDSSDDNRLPRGRGYPNERGRPPEKERYPNSDSRPPRRGGLPSNGRPPDRYGGGHPMKEDPLMEEDCMMEEDHPMEEDLLRMEVHQMETEGP